MADYVPQISYFNPLTSSFQSIEDSGIDYSAYDKDSYLWDQLQNAWNYFIGGDSNWGDSQAVENRQKADDYAHMIIDGNNGIYDNLNADDYKVADNIRNMYDVDQAKGLGLLTGAMNWAGDKLYDTATQSDDSQKILTNLMQGNNDNIYLTDPNGNSVHYTLGQDVYNALLNGSDEDYQYVDNVLRTIGSDLSKSGKSIDDVVNAGDWGKLALYYDSTLGKSNGEYDKNLEALDSGGEGSTIVKGNRNGSSNGVLFTENGKYNALAGNSNAANALDVIDIASTAIPVVGGGKNLLGKGVTLITKGAKGAESAAKGAKGAEAAAGAAKGAKAAAGVATPVANAVDAANAARGSMAANNAASAAANAARTTTPASGGITANAANLASNGPRVIDFEKVREAQAAAKGAQATKGAEAANKATADAATQASQSAASTVPAAAEAANDSRIMQNIGNLADSAKGRVNDFRLNRDIRKAQKDFSKAQKQGSKAKDTEAANDTLDYSKFDNDIAQRLMGNIATGKTPELNTDAEKATWAILQSKAPSARSKVLNNAKNVGKFMTNPKNIYLGNSVSDIVSSPIEEARRNEQEARRNAQGVRRQNITVTSIPFRNMPTVEDLSTGEIYYGW